MGKKKDARKAARRAAEVAAERGASGAAGPQLQPFVLPDELRRMGEALIAKANSPQGREVIASGLALAASAAAAKAGRQRRQSPQAGEEWVAPRVPPIPPAAPQPPVPPVAPQPGVGGTLPVDPQAVADAIGDAAAVLLTRLFGATRPM